MMHKIKQFYGKVKVVTYYKVHLCIEDYPYRVRCIHQWKKVYLYYYYNHTSYNDIKSTTTKIKNSEDVLERRTILRYSSMLEDLNHK